MVLGIFTSRAANRESRRVGQYAGELEGKYGELQTGLAQDSLTDLSRLTGEGIGAVQNYGAQALSALGQGRADSRQDLFDYTMAAREAANTGRNQANTSLDQAIVGYDPYIRTGGAANTLYADSLGLNGTAGNARATGAFQTGPGYEFQRDEATDAAARKASALGIAGSGNTLTALATLGSNLANQEYGSWQTRLAGLGAQGLSATGAVGSLRAQQGANNMAEGQTQTGLLSSLGAGLADINTGYGVNAANTLAGIGSNTANMLGAQSGTQANIRGNLGNALTNTGMQAASMVNGASGQAAAAKGAMGDSVMGAVTNFASGFTPLSSLSRARR